MKQKFVDQTLTAARLEMIGRINEILATYDAAGYTLTVRQLYYQLVARDFIPNNQASYDRIVDLVSVARLAGLVDWEMIEDRGRVVAANPHWNSPGEIVQSAAYSFAIDKWRDQKHRILVMVEKQALEGILIPVCRELDIRFAANKGYSSLSALYRLGRQLYNIRLQGQTPIILYLGDHDPSGIDMTRDVRDRLKMFSGLRIGVDRLALNMDQIEVLQPPENPAKLSDSRAEAYIAEFGYSSWELDAVEPGALADLVHKAVANYRDDDAWNEAVARENEMRAELQRFADQYNNPEMYNDD